MTNIKFTHHHTLVRKASFYSFCTAGQVLIAITNYARETFKGSGKWACFPSYAKLSEDTGVVERTVQTHVKRLISIGLITITKQLNGRVNVYEMNIDKIFNPTPETLTQLNNASPTSRVKAIVDAAFKSLDEWKEKKGFQKKEKSYPQPKQFKIADGDGYTVKTSDLKDPANSVLKKDLLEKEQHAASAIPSLKDIFPSKRQIEMRIQGAKYCIQNLCKQITCNHDHSDISRLQAELDKQRQIIAQHTHHAEYYGLAL